MKGVQNPDHAIPHHTIWLSSPDSLNDPYDCWLHIDLKELGFDFELAKIMYGFGLVKNLTLPVGNSPFFNALAPPPSKNGKNRI